MSCERAVGWSVVSIHFLFNADGHFAFRRASGILFGIVTFWCSDALVVLQSLTVKRAKRVVWPW